jgi:hypothetical protein
MASYHRAMPRPTIRRLRAPAPHRTTLAGLVAFAALLVGACSAAGPSFAPEGPCAGDGRLPGTYPTLEAEVPKTFENRPPTRLDSGRTCTVAGLESLAGAGIREVRYAGGLWDLGSGRGATLAIFQGDGLDASKMFQFYESGAKGSSRTKIKALTTPTIQGRPGHRIDTEAGDVLQTVVVWPGADAGRVNVVLTSDFPDAKIQAAVDAFGDR